MEILIVGLILVAVMVYASTRIKKTAAAAFEPETIETEDFIIQKPEGFLNVIGGDPKFAFEAYSKDFGGFGAEDIRQATAKLSIHDGMSLDDAIAALESAGNEITSDIGEVIAEQKYRVLDAKRTVKGVELNVSYKLAEKEGSVYEFEIASLADAGDELRRRIETMLNSFEIK